MKLYKFITVFFIFPVILIFSQGKNSTENITIFFTTGTNGHPLKFSYMQDEGQGGIPARAALIKKLSKNLNQQNIIILDAGSVIRGRAESNLYNGETDITGMDNINYYACGVGLSELWIGLNEFSKLNTKAKNFYFLCSNILKKSDDKPICDDYNIKKIGGFNGIKIGFFSVISEEAFNILPGDIKSQYKFIDPLESAKKTVEMLKSKPNEVDLIIALTYLGYEADDTKTTSKTLAASIDGIDIILDSKNPLKMQEPVSVNNTKICQAFKWGLFLGKIDMAIDENNKISDFKFALHPVNYRENGKFVEEELEQDKKVLRAINNKMFNYTKLMKEEIAELKNSNLDTKNVRLNETVIGDLVCDAMIDYTGADAAFQNAGGFGEGMLPEGPVLRNSFDDLLKYDNSIVLLDMTGDEIYRIIEFSMKNQGRGSFLQVGGLRFTYSKTEGKIKDVLINGNKIDKSAFYRVAINSWLAAGNDGYKIFTQLPNKIDLNILHREVLYEYLEKKKEINAEPDGRITITD